MPYVAEHEKSCQNKDRYLIIREVMVIEHRRGSILDNSDRGKVISVICENCKAPAVWR